MPEDEQDDLESQALREEHALLVARLAVLAARYREIRAEQAKSRTQEAIAARLGITRDEVRTLERRGLLKARRAAERLLSENQP